MPPVETKGLARRLMAPAPPLLAADAMAAAAAPAARAAAPASPATVRLPVVVLVALLAAAPALGPAPDSPAAPTPTMLPSPHFVDALLPRATPRPPKCGGLRRGAKALSEGGGGSGPRIDAQPWRLSPGWSPASGTRR